VVAFLALYVVHFRRSNYQRSLSKHAVRHQQGQTALVGPVAIRVKASLEISSLG